MQLPIDIKEVFDAATDIDAARQTPLSVSVYIDETAPGDVQALVRQSFSSASPHAQVSILYIPHFDFKINTADDMAVIVAGVDENIGSYASQARKAGVPVMIVTTLPLIVQQISVESGFELLRDDVIAPIEKSHKNALPTKSQVEAEPYALTDERSDLIRARMGTWIIDTCKEKRLAFALAFPFMRRVLSLESVRATAAQNAGVGLVAFIPGADMPIMTLNQSKMLLQIAAAYGQALNMERVKELAAVVGGAFAFRSVARQLVAFVPAIGWAIKAAIGYTGTQAMGHAAIEYFEGGGNISGLAEIVKKARNKAVQAAEVVRNQPGFTDAVKSAGEKIGSTAQSVAGKVVPVASSVIDSTIDIASEAGVVSEHANKSTKRVTRLLSDRFKKDVN